MIRTQTMPSAHRRALRTNIEGVEPGAEGGAGGGEGGGGGGDGGAAAAAAAAAAAQKPFYEGFTNEALKTSPSIQRYKSVEEMAAGYIAAEKRLGIPKERLVELPADPKDEAAMRAVYTKLGLPEKADGYGFKLDDKASDADKDMLGKFTVAAHKAGMPADMAKAALDFWSEQVGAATAAAETSAAARATEGKATLQTQLGQAFEPRMKEVDGALAKYFSPAMVEAMKDDGKFQNPDFTQGIIKMLDRMAEPGVAGGQGGDGDTGSRAMSPAQAKAAATELEAHPAFRDANHAQHKAIVAQRQNLLAMTV